MRSRVNVSAAVLWLPIRTTSGRTSKRASSLAQVERLRAQTQQRHAARLRDPQPVGAPTRRRATRGRGSPPRPARACRARAARRARGAAPARARVHPARRRSRAARPRRGAPRRGVERAQELEQRETAVSAPVRLRQLEHRRGQLERQPEAARASAARGAPRRGAASAQRRPPRAPPSGWASPSAAALPAAAQVVDHQERAELTRGW